MRTKVNTNVSVSTIISILFLSLCVACSDADARNRAAIATALQQYVVQCERAVLVMPLRYARIQPSEDDGSFSSSSSINAHEVWDMLTAGWRCHEAKQQLFAVVATETWELGALFGNKSMVWQLSSYREHMQERDDEEQTCEVCKRGFTTRSWRDGLGCDHEGRVIRYAGANLYVYIYRDNNDEFYFF